MFFITLDEILTPEIRDMLIGKYSEPHRRYHGLGHIKHFQSMSDLWGHHIFRPVEFELAIWFHDAIYDPTSKCNEEQSAQLFESCMFAVRSKVVARQAFSVAQEYEDEFKRLTARVSAMITATVHHKPIDYEITDEVTFDKAWAKDRALFLDLDLSVFSADPQESSKANRAIRQEYRHLSEVEWRKGRYAFLQGMLARRPFYHTKAVSEAWAERAQLNIREELRFIDEQAAKEHAEPKATHRGRRGRR